MPKLFSHYSGYAGQWPWPDFTPAEIACKHCGELYLDPESMDALQELRDAWGKPIIINSAHRCAAHNKAAGGSPNSRHLKIAFDCRCSALEQADFCRHAQAAGFKGFGRYPSRGFVHLDLGPRRSWRG